RDNEYLGIRPSQLTKLYKAPAALFYKLVALQPVTFARPEDWRLHLQLRSVAHNLLLSQLRPEMAAGRDELLPSIANLVTAYSVYPQIMVNTFGLLDTCSFDFDFDAVKNKQLYTSSRYDDRLLLEKLAYEGMERRYGPDNTIARQRIAKEIETIDELGFSAYFLITWDMTRYSASQGIAHVGRGSGASSVVAYSLGITNVCPIQLDLYFERFLNPNRKTPPDFDIDYSHRDRDQVFEYMFRRWGRAHTAILGTMSTFGDRSIIREIAKIYGLPKEEIDRLIADPTAAENRHPITAKVAAFYRQLPANFPNLRSVHAGGILISEQPISYYTAVDMPPKGLPTTQFDMYLAEEIGFEKLDILSQRGISNIKEAAT
ncbi:MAG: DNA polymerase III subunit alpha, partial [Bacteroidetes bacterium]|nr:DNA polymerase III subunit alpha [Bacteroidota bacterium]